MKLQIKFLKSSVIKIKNKYKPFVNGKNIIDYTVLVTI